VKRQSAVSEVRLPSLRSLRLTEKPGAVRREHDLRHAPVPALGSRAKQERPVRMGSVGDVQASIRPVDHPVVAVAFALVGCLPSVIEPAEGSGTAMAETISQAQGAGDSFFFFFGSAAQQWLQSVVQRGGGWPCRSAPAIGGAIAGPPAQAHPPEFLAEYHGDVGMSFRAMPP